MDFGPKSDGVTALFQAATQGFVEVVRFLVEEGKATWPRRGLVWGHASLGGKGKGTRRSCASWWRRARRTWTR